MLNVWLALSCVIIVLLLPSKPKWRDWRDEFSNRISRDTTVLDCRGSRFSGFRRHVSAKARAAFHLRGRREA